jgi:hypothetical protein
MNLKFTVQFSRGFPVPGQAGNVSTLCCADLLHTALLGRVLTRTVFYKLTSAWKLYDSLTTGPPQAGGPL